jgi:hypothetical protein
MLYSWRAPPTSVTDIQLKYRYVCHVSGDVPISIKRGTDTFTQLLRYCSTGNYGQTSGQYDAHFPSTHFSSVDEQPWSWILKNTTNTAVRLLTEKYVKVNRVKVTKKLWEVGLRYRKVTKNRLKAKFILSLCYWLYFSSLVHNFHLLLHTSQ